MHYLNKYLYKMYYIISLHQICFQTRYYMPTFQFFLFFDPSRSFDFRHIGNITCYGKHISEPPYPIYALQSAVLVLFHLHNHFVSPFMDFQCFNWTIGLKVKDFVFLNSILPNMLPFLHLPEPLQPIYTL